MADEMANGARQGLKYIQSNKPVNIEVYKERPNVARDNCSGIM